jgi:hypothetical protein
MHNLSDLLCEIEFDYTMNDSKQVQLIDTLGANLGNIESEVFEADNTEDLKLIILDRLDIYWIDYGITAVNNPANIIFDLITKEKE